MRTLISHVLYLALIPSLGLACANLPKTSNKQPSARSTAKPTPNIDDTPKQNLWGYREHDDEMGRGRVYFTSIESTNTISLEFPYEGQQHCVLSIREDPAFGKDVYIRIEKGQLLSSEYHGKVAVRFDGDKPLAFSSVSPADLSTETLFLRGNAFQIFLSRLKTAKTLRIEVPVYQAGNQVCIFNVERFTWKTAK
jgi:hypothetical protein